MTSVILLKASGSTLSGIHSGSDDKALENSVSIAMLDSSKPFRLRGQEHRVRVDV